MPSTKKKRPPPSSKKLRTVTSADGWSHVVRGPSATALTTAATPSSSSAAPPLDAEDGDEEGEAPAPAYPSPSDLPSSLQHQQHQQHQQHRQPRPPARPRPTPAAPDLTLAALQAQFARAKARWRASPARPRFDEVLRRRVVAACAGAGDVDVGADGADARAAAAVAVERVLVLGLGPVAGVNREMGRRALGQLAAVEDWVEVLGGAVPGLDSSIFLQDPSFGPLDEEFLRDRGHRVIHDPESDLVVAASPSSPSSSGSATFVFAPYIESDILTATLAAAHPAIFIGTDPRWFLPEARWSSANHAGKDDSENKSREGEALLRRYLDSHEVMDPFAGSADAESEADAMACHFVVVTKKSIEERDTLLEQGSEAMD